VWHTGAQGQTDYRDGYTGAYDTSPFNLEQGDTTDRMRDTAAFDRSEGYPGPDGDRGWGPEPEEQSSRGRGHRARHGRYDDEDDHFSRPGRRRWPVVTGALVLLVLLIGGGAYGFWQYNQRQYYVSVSPAGFVSIFRGTDQSVAGISLSSLQSQSTLKASMLTSADQATLQQTISANSLTDAEHRIDSLQTQVNNCQQRYTELAAWQTKYLAYQRYLTAKAMATKTKTKAPAVVASPGAMPTQVPGADECATSTVFGIQASALPTSGESAPPATTASPSPTPSASVKSTATAKPTASASATATAG
jgi:hypothetical protein